MPKYTYKYTIYSYSYKISTYLTSFKHLGYLTQRSAASSPYIDTDWLLLSAFCLPEAALDSRAHLGNPARFSAADWYETGYARNRWSTPSWPYGQHNVVGQHFQLHRICNWKTLKRPRICQRTKWSCTGGHLLRMLSGNACNTIVPSQWRKTLDGEVAGLKPCQEMNRYYRQQDCYILNGPRKYSQYDSNQLDVAAKKSALSCLICSVFS